MSESVIGNDVPRLSSPPITACIASEILVFAICGSFCCGNSYLTPGLGLTGAQSLGSPGKSQVVKRHKDKIILYVSIILVSRVLAVASPARRSIITAPRRDQLGQTLMPTSLVSRYSTMPS